MPLTPLTANTARDPYPYYAMLRETGPFFKDSDSGIWLATSEHAVRTVFESNAKTRPENVPVPPSIHDTTAGRVFGHLVRMTDGPTQARVKSAMIRAIAKIHPQLFEIKARATAASILRNRSINPTELAFQVPVRTMAGILGFSPDREAQAADLVEDFVRCMSPFSRLPEFEAAISAADKLEPQVAQLIKDGAPGLASEFRNALSETDDFDAKLCIANAIGLMSQTFDPTGALISIALTTMARFPKFQAAFEKDPIGYLREAARFDAPIQNTRRVFAADDHVLGRDVKAGDSVLLLLASANRDPSANSRPDQFDPTRPELTSFTFSHGAHRCPGEEIALHVASGALKALLVAGLNPLRLNLESLTYKPSINARIPILVRSPRPHRCSYA